MYKLTLPDWTCTDRETQEQDPLKEEGRAQTAVKKEEAEIEIHNTKLSQYGFDGWAVLEWECCIKSNEQGAVEGAKFIKDHIIQVTEKSFDDFADSGSDEEGIKKILGFPKLNF